MASVDGLRTNWFEPGGLYAVGPAFGCLFLAEGWAQPVLDEQPARLMPERQTYWEAADAEQPNLVRGRWSPYLDDFSPASDLERRRHRR
jgi:hypothetical protein